MCSPRPGSLSDGAVAIIEARFSDLRQTLPRLPAKGVFLHQVRTTSGDGFSGSHLPVCPLSMILISCKTAQISRGRCGLTVYTRKESNLSTFPLSLQSCTHLSLQIITSLGKNRQGIKKRSQDDRGLRSLPPFHTNTCTDSCFCFALKYEVGA